MFVEKIINMSLKLELIAETKVNTIYEFDIKFVNIGDTTYLLDSKITENLFPIRNSMFSGECIVGEIYDLDLFNYNRLITSKDKVGKYYRYSIINNNEEYSFIVFDNNISYKTYLILDSVNKIFEEFVKNVNLYSDEEIIRNNFMNVDKIINDFNIDVCNLDLNEINNINDVVDRKKANELIDVIKSIYKTCFVLRFMSSKLYKDICFDKDRKIYIELILSDRLAIQNIHFQITLFANVDIYNDYFKFYDLYDYYIEILKRSNIKHKYYKSNKKFDLLINLPGYDLRLFLSSLYDVIRFKYI